MKATEVEAERREPASDAVPASSPCTERLGKAVMLGGLIVAMMLAPGRACGEETIGSAPVRYVANLRLWLLTTEQTSYVMGLNERAELQTLYWGGKLTSDRDLTAARLRPEYNSFDSQEGMSNLEYPDGAAGITTSPP